MIMINNNIGMTSPSMGMMGSPMVYGPPAMPTMGMQSFQPSLGATPFNPLMSSAMPAPNLFPGAMSGTTIINNYNGYGANPLGASPFTAQPFPAMASSPTIINNFGGMGMSPLVAQGLPMGGMMSNSASFGVSPFGVQSFPGSGAPIVINNYTGGLGDISFANDSSWISPPVLSSEGPPLSVEYRAESRQNRLEDQLDLLSNRLERQQEYPEAQPHTDRADRYLETAGTQLQRADLALDDGKFGRALKLQHRASDSLTEANIELNYGGRDIHAALAQPYHINISWG